MHIGMRNTNPRKLFARDEEKSHNVSGEKKKNISRKVSAVGSGTRRRAGRL